MVTLPVCFATAQKQDDRCMGYVSLSCDRNRVGPNGAEIGFRTAKWAWGQGYATEVAQGLIATASARGEIYRIGPIVDPNNFHSIRVLKKLGMGLKGGVMLDGYDYADHLYALNMCVVQQ
ncbi:MAG: GNAT family N-acetyltransferase [Roseobacter sp.]